MTKQRHDLVTLLMAEVATQVGSHEVAVAPTVAKLAKEMQAMQTMVDAGELTLEQAALHRQLRLDAFNMQVLAVEGMDGVHTSQMVDGLWRVIRRFYGV